MGYDAYSRIIIAIPTANLPWKVYNVITSTVTKFNPDTGEPYKKEIKEDRAFVRDEDVTEKTGLDLSGYLEEYLPDFEPITNGCEDSNDAKMVGWVVAEEGGRSSDQQPQGVGDLEAVTKLFTQMKQELAEAGIEAEPRMYTWMYHCY